ncbi:MAG: ATP-binding cassette domain-containing protein [Gemmatimonadales bacterium]
MPSALSLRNISRQFGTVTALRAVTFELAVGEVHALLGENGAGKSTLMKVAFGLVRPDSGSIAVDGIPVQLRSPVEARRAGIGMVHQHFTSISALTVWENVALTAGWSVRRPGVVAERVHALAQHAGLALDPRSIVRDLTAGLKQRLEVLKAIAADARILLLDEPSSVLSPAEAEQFLGQITAFKALGISTVLITHKLSEALGVADTVTVLRHGSVVHHGPIRETNARTLARHLLGEVSIDRPQLPPPVPGNIVVRASQLSVDRLGVGGTGLRRATFSARAGEVIGIAAIEGNGQRELLRAIAGLVRVAGGSLEVTAPVALVPEDRTSEALIGDFTLAENLVLSQGRSAPWIHGPWIDWPDVHARTRELIERFEVRASGSAMLARELSGGNQQRLVIAAALERRPAVLVAENPTRGLDFKASADVHERLRATAAAGVAVIVYLADLDELLAVADRVVVLTAGIAHEMTPGASRTAIGRLMLAGPEE